VDSQWGTGYQVTLTVKNSGTSASSGWTANFSLGGTQTVVNSWNATVSGSGTQVTATNASYNGAIPAGGSTAFGMVLNGTPQAPANLTCTLR